MYGALVNKGTEPADNDWEKLDNLSKIKLDGSKCKVDIVPDTANGTPADSDSGKPVVKNVAAKNNKNVPKTGDNANVLLWIALAVISCGVLAGAGVAVRKRK